MGARKWLDTVLGSTINNVDYESMDVAYMIPSKPYKKSNFLGYRGNMVSRLKLKGIDGMELLGVKPVA